MTTESGGVFKGAFFIAHDEVCNVKQARADSYARALNLLPTAQINRSRGYRGGVRRDAELFKVCARSKLPSARDLLLIDR